MKRITLLLSVLMVLAMMLTACPAAAPAPRARRRLRGSGSAPLRDHLLPPNRERDRAGVAGGAGPVEAVADRPDDLGLPRAASGPAGEAPDHVLREPPGGEQHAGGRRSDHPR